MEVSEPSKFLAGIEASAVFMKFCQIFAGVVPPVIPGITSLSSQPIHTTVTKSGV